ncbi:class I SAM-dependent methyltransferase [Kiloniella sp. EL199]|uniref:class I SAM-dependent DNA methyltransferase n=1 Tax=Kiloniella sp. EL199 TaxID=2107581 RepID=UPI000EA0AF3E|nr:class I SAM-dependent methyltransferase [Kiloniella sp. EL199]
MTVSDTIAFDHYHDPVLTRLYDKQNPWGPDCDFFLSLVLGYSVPQKILDVGCGTGLLTTAFARQGHDITGVDPAQNMLDIALQRSSGNKVTWIKSDAATFTSDKRYDLIVLSGHAFQVFLSDQDIQTVLSNMKTHLSPDGRIAFDTRNAAAKAWLNWTPELTTETFMLRGNPQYSTDKEIAVWHDVGSVTSQGKGAIVQYFTLYREIYPSQVDLLSNTNEYQSDTTKTEAYIRFLSQQELSDHLEEAGLKVEQLYGDWDRSLFRNDHKEMIVIARAG